MGKIKITYSNKCSDCSFNIDSNTKVVKAEKKFDHSYLLVEGCLNPVLCPYKGVLLVINHYLIPDETKSDKIINLTEEIEEEMFKSNETGLITKINQLSNLLETLFQRKNKSTQTVSIDKETSGRINLLCKTFSSISKKNRTKGKFFYPYNGKIYCARKVDILWEQEKRIQTLSDLLDLLIIKAENILLFEIKGIFKTFHLCYSPEKCIRVSWRINKLPEIKNIKTNQKTIEKVLKERIKTDIIINKDLHTAAQILVENFLTQKQKVFLENRLNDLLLTIITLCNKT